MLWGGPPAPHHPPGAFAVKGLVTDPHAGKDQLQKSAGKAKNLPYSIPKEFFSQIHTLCEQVDFPF